MKLPLDRKYKLSELDHRLLIYSHKHLYHNSNKLNYSPFIIQTISSYKLYIRLPIIYSIDLLQGMLRSRTSKSLLKLMRKFKWNKVTFAIIMNTTVLFSLLDTMFEVIAKQRKQIAFLV